MSAITNLIAEKWVTAIASPVKLPMQVRTMMSQVFLLARRDTHMRSDFFNPVDDLCTPAGIANSRLASRT